MLLQTPKSKEHDVNSPKTFMTLVKLWLNQLRWSLQTEWRKDIKWIKTHEGRQTDKVSNNVI